MSKKADLVKNTKENAFCTKNNGIFLSSNNENLVPELNMRERAMSSSSSESKYNIARTWRVFIYIILFWFEDDFDTASPSHHLSISLSITLSLTHTHSPNLFFLAPSGELSIVSEASTAYNENRWLPFFYFTLVDTTLFDFVWLAFFYFFLLH